MSEANLLDLDLSSVDTSFPVIRGGIYDLIVKEFDVVENANKDGENIKIKLATTAPCKGVKGEDIGEGHPLTEVISLKTKSDKKTEDQMREMIVRNFAQFLQAVKPAVTGITGRDLFDGSIKIKGKAVLGRMVRAKVDALPERRDQKSGKTLQAGNDIISFVKN